MLTVEVLKDSTPTTRSGVTTDGREWSITTQPVFVHEGDHYPARREIRLDSERDAFQPGTYEGVLYWSENKRGYILSTLKATA